MTRGIRIFFAIFESTHGSQESWTPSCEWNTAQSCWIPNGQRRGLAAWPGGKKYKNSNRGLGKKGWGIKQEYTKKWTNVSCFHIHLKSLQLSTFAIVLSESCDGFRWTWKNDICQLIDCFYWSSPKGLGSSKFFVSFYAWCFLKNLSDAGVTWPVHMRYVFIVSNLTMNFTGYIIGERVWNKSPTSFRYTLEI